MALIDRLAADLICLKGALRTLKATTPIAKNPTRIFPVVIDELADRYGDAPALISERERLSYRELNELLPALSARGVHVQLVTSAVRAIPQQWRGLAGLTIVVSIDRKVEQKQHDAVRAG